MPKKNKVNSKLLVQITRSQRAEIDELSKQFEQALAAIGKLPNIQARAEAVLMASETLARLVKLERHVYGID